MHKHLFNLLPADLDRLGNRIIEFLDNVFPFSEFIFFPISEHVEGLPPIKLSDRQRQRALEALSHYYGFWDRIGQQFLIPIRNSSTPSIKPLTLGTLVISKVNNSLGPEEAKSYLTILQSLVENKLKVLKAQTLFSKKGEIPLYVYLALETIFKKGETSISLLHFIQKPSANARYGDPKVVIEICSKLWKNCHPEWLGGNYVDFWILLPEVDENRLSSGLRQFVQTANTMKILVSKVYGHYISGTFDIGELKNNLYGVERLAENLGTAVFCTIYLKYLEERLGFDDLILRFDQVKKVINVRSKYAIAYIKSVPDELKDTIKNYGTFCSAGNDNAFLIRKFDNKAANFDLAQWGRKIHKLCSINQDKPVTIGIAASSQAEIGPSKAPIAALWAFIHADLLGSGSLAIYDSLTCNVKGDEILCWGDLINACRNYRLGLKMDPLNTNLLNSLGVCLAELGRIKEATDTLSRAINSYPENFMAFYNLGGIYYQQGDLQSALKILERAYKLKPDDIRLAGRMAEVLIETGHSKKALDLLAPFMDNHSPLPGAIFRILGKAYKAVDRWQDAKRSWQQAIKNNHQDAESMALLALGYLEETDNKEIAKRLGQQAGKFSNKSKKIHSILSQLNKKLNSFGIQE